MTIHPTPGVYHDGTRAYLDGRRLAVWVLHGQRLGGDSDATIAAMEKIGADRDNVIAAAFDVARLGRLTRDRAPRMPMPSSSRR